MTIVILLQQSIDFVYTADLGGCYSRREFPDDKTTDTHKSQPAKSERKKDESPIYFTIDKNVLMLYPFLDDHYLSFVSISIDFSL